MTEQKRPVLTLKRKTEGETPYSKALHFKNSAYQAHFAQGITIIKC